jgi:Zn-dependent hydrolases, including glyoxylases
MRDPWTEVADRVYVRRHKSMDLNVSLIVGEGACLVVDTRATEKEGQDLVEAVRTVTPHPWVVVNTHFHFDHTFGNSLFRPAEIWGHRRCAEQLIEDGERMRGPSPVATASTGWTRWPPRSRRARSTRPTSWSTTWPR